MLKVFRNPDVQFYEKITKAVKDNDNHCPCMLQKTDDTLCMCKAFREQNTKGFCHCKRFMKVEVPE